MAAPAVLVRRPPRLRGLTGRSARSAAIGRRLVHGLIVVAAVATVVFVVTRMTSDPVRRMLPIDATQEQYDELQAQLGLDRPLVEQFGSYAGDLVRFDLGTSYWLNRPVTDLLADRLPQTLLLVTAATGLALVGGVLLGVTASLRPGSKRDRVLSAGAMLGVSIPQFWLGSVLILVFAVNLGWLPTSGTGTWKHMVLPTIALALPSIARVAQTTRGAMIEELGTSHIKVAHAKGLPLGYIVGRHALRNVLVPITTIVGYELTYSLAGAAVIVETVFAWQGIGYLTIQAVRRQDLVLLQGIVFAIALLVVVLNLVVDVLYTVIDKRIDL